MKKILVFGIMMNAFFVKGQTYVPIPLDSIVWKIFIDYDDHVCHEEHVFDYVLKSDTVIGSYTYKSITSDNFALYSHIWGSPYCSPYGLLPSGYYFGALRQDTISKKVFIVLPGENSDYLLYDFNLGVNDTLFSSTLTSTSTWPCPTTFDIVQSIDSVLIGSSYRRRWNFQCIFPIIDGIGSTHDPFGSSPPYWLSCVILGNTTYHAYGWSSFPDSILLSNACSFVTEVAPKENITKQFNLSPNPFSSSLTLHFPSPQNSPALLKVFNSIGEAVLEKEIKLEDQTLNVAALPQGIYLVSVRTEEGVFTEKIVK